MKILVVEDVEINQMIIEEFLESLGHDVTLVSNGREAVDLMGNTSKEFNCILMDLQMPIMGGIDACLEIRNLLLNKEIPIVALTADESVGIKGEIDRAGMNGYLKKPIIEDELVALLKSITA